MHLFSISQYFFLPKTARNNLAILYFADFKAQVLRSPPHPTAPFLDLLPEPQTYKTIWITKYLILIKVKIFNITWWKTFNNYTISKNLKYKVHFWQLVPPPKFPPLSLSSSQLSCGRRVVRWRRAPPCGLDPHYYNYTESSLEPRTGWLLQQCCCWPPSSFIPFPMSATNVLLGAWNICVLSPCFVVVNNGESV